MDFFFFRRGTNLRPRYGTLNYQVPVMIAALILILIVTLASFREGAIQEEESGEKYLVQEKQNGQKHNFVPGSLKPKWNTIGSSVQFHPIIEYRNGTDLISQIPDSPKAVLFLAHGCNGRAVNFWDRSPRCPKCVGLPEERLILLHALSRKYAVLAISSAGRCWTFGEERIVAKDIITWWIEKNNLGKLPLVALGASSGGYFVSALALDLRFSSITLMIAEGLFDQVEIPENYPPTLFVHMPKDTYRQMKIREFMELMRSKGIDVAEIECLDVRLSPNFLAERIPGIDLSTSKKLFELFKNKGFIDENRYMKKDGRATHWKEAVGELKSISLEKRLIHPVQEELNLAFAYHEMTSLQCDEIFKWFGSHMR